MNNFFVGPAALLILPILGVGLLWWLRLASLRGAIRNPITVLILTTICWTAIWFGLTLSLIFCFLLLSIPGVLLLILFCSSLMLRKRQLEGQQILTLLSLAAQRGVPLYEAADAMASESNNEMGLRSARLSQLLRRGTPLPTALIRSRLPVPLEVQLAASIRGSSRQMASLLALEGVRVEKVRDTWRRGYEMLLYFTFVLTATTCVYVFLARQCIPTLLQVRKDFQITSGPLESWFTTHMSDIGAVSTMLVSLLLFVVLIGAVYYAGWLRTPLPLLFRITHRLQKARILNYVAVGVVERRPITDLLAALAEDYPRHSIRKSLRSAHRMVEQGTDWLRALRQHNLLDDLELDLLRAAVQAGNVSWTLRQLADRNDVTTQLFWERAIRVAGPLAIFLFALPVLAMSLYIFDLLTQLIYNLI